MPVEPDEQQFADVAALVGSDADGPVVMLNLNGYRDREAYMRYGEVASAVLARVGGRILEARAHRLAGLERAALICCGRAQAG